MIGRRQLLGAATASLALAKVAGAQAAGAAAAVTARGLPAGLPRGADGRLARLATLDLESLQDFTLGFRVLYGKKLRLASAEAFDRLL